MSIFSFLERFNKTYTNWQHVERIYENGVDIDIAKLYPSVVFPVSRGTPMISPLIKWEHSEDHFVTRYESKIPKCERIITVNISDNDFDFISGHTIDGKFQIVQNLILTNLLFLSPGRVLFPATGYLYIGMNIVVT